MRIEPPKEIKEKIQFENEHWVCTEELTEEENLLLFEFNQRCADLYEEESGKLPYKVLENQNGYQNVMYRGNIYIIWFDQYMFDMYARCDNLPLKYARYNPSKYVSHGRYENFMPNHNVDLSSKLYIEGFVTDRLHDYLYCYIQEHHINSVSFAPIYSAEYGKPFRFGDHYRDSVPNGYGAFYKDNQYRVIRMDSEQGYISSMKSFDTFRTWSQYIEHDLKK